MRTRDSQGKIIAEDLRDETIFNFKLTNFTYYDAKNNENEINFTNGLAMLVGPNGGGKSTILKTILEIVGPMYEYKIPFEKAKVSFTTSNSFLEFFDFVNEFKGHPLHPLNISIPEETEDNSFAIEYSRSESKLYWNSTKVGCITNDLQQAKIHKRFGNNNNNNNRNKNAPPNLILSREMKLPGINWNGARNLISTLPQDRQETLNFLSSKVYSLQPKKLDKICEFLKTLYNTEVIFKIHSRKNLYDTEKFEKFDANTSSDLQDYEVFKTAYELINKPTSDIFHPKLAEFSKFGCIKIIPKSEDQKILFRKSGLNSDYFEYQNLPGSIQQGLLIAVSLVRNNGTLLLDEPDIHLDEHSKEKLRNYITEASKKFSIGVVTHSPELIDHSVLPSLYYLNDLISIQPITDNNLSSNLSTSKLLFYSKVILVEGRDDSRVIKVLLQLLNFSNWSVYPTNGGKDKNAREVLNRINHQHVLTLCDYDSIVDNKLVTNRKRFTAKNWDPIKYAELLKEIASDREKNVVTVDDNTFVWKLELEQIFTDDALLYLLSQSSLYKHIRRMELENNEMTEMQRKKLQEKFLYNLKKGNITLHKTWKSINKQAIRNALTMTLLDKSSENELFLFCEFINCHEPVPKNLALILEKLEVYNNNNNNINKNNNINNETIDSD